MLCNSVINYVKWGVWLQAKQQCWPLVSNHTQLKGFAQQASWGDAVLPTAYLHAANALVSWSGLQSRAQDPWDGYCHMRVCIRSLTPQLRASSGVYTKELFSTLTQYFYTPSSSLSPFWPSGPQRGRILLFRAPWQWDSCPTRVASPDSPQCYFMRKNETLRNWGLFLPPVCNVTVSE